MGIVKIIQISVKCFQLLLVIKVPYSLRSTLMRLRTGNSFIILLSSDSDIKKTTFSLDVKCSSCLRWKTFSEYLFQ